MRQHSLTDIFTLIKDEGDSLMLSGSLMVHLYSHKQLQRGRHRVGDDDFSGCKNSFGVSGSYPGSLCLWVLEINRRYFRPD